MKLFRNLIYILSALFVLGVILVIVVDPTLVMSRIATGLTTGAFVGLINAIVNYAHSRAAFWGKLLSGLSVICTELCDEYDTVKMDYRILSEDSVYQIVLTLRKDKYIEYSELKLKNAQYDKFIDLFRFDSFAGILPIDKRVSIAVDFIFRFLEQDLKRLTYTFALYNKYSLLPSLSLYNEIQDDDAWTAIIESLTDKTKRHRDNLAFVLDKLTKLLSFLETTCKNTISSFEKETIQRIKETVERHIKGAEIRDVWK